MYVPRLLEPTFRNALKTFPATFVGGPRQSGKTTLVQTLLSDTHTYVSLDELDIRSFAVDDPRGFFERYQPPVIIDEIQHVPQLLPYIKARIDEDRRAGNWILTGSQQWALMRNISESLAGRIAVLCLHPFAISEMTSNLRLQLRDAISFVENLKKTTSKFDKSIPLGDWILNGGYPEIFINKEISHKLWFSSYVQTYLDRDIRGNLRTSNLLDFEKFLQILAGRTSQELNFSTLSRDVGVSVPTIKSWVTLLEASGIIYLLPPYHRNFGKRLIKSPKCYFMDSGLVCYLVGLYSTDHLLKGPLAGPLFETVCVTQFIKRFSALSDPSSLFFWRSTDGLEVDLIIESAGQLIPIECKLTSTLNTRHLQSLDRWRRIAGSRVQDALVISSSDRGGLIRQTIYNCHYSWL